ncbi:invasion associated locus B family protein [Paracoccus sp. SCSIO 75233]|uniref:invasion associated locus B family protein n=1 Tax=Paracoccus sp. SCSIO 75233 TaxID=3017782 RepID=UPI0022F010E1|nr:invasion associated locus B family protein [Paracoccus sp. SCSIO 75233]WBU54372.1 invasion associated locus B family protein [Paracoccus sp. SCSIO 75233]
MSPIKTSTALAVILALGASPILAQTAQDAADSATEMADQATENAQQMADDAVQAAEDAVNAATEEAQGTVDQLTQDAQNAVSEALGQSEDEAATDDSAAEADATEAAAPAADAAKTDTSATEAPAEEAAATEEPATEAPATEDATTEEAAPDAAATEETATEEAAAPAEPQIGAYYVRSTHDAWTLRCIRTESGADPCELYQLLRDGQGTSVAEVTLIPLENGGQAVAGATIVAPLETDLVSGLALRIDSGERNGYPFNFCAPVGCISRIGLTQSELDRFKRGNVATVSLLPYGAPREEVFNLEMSLAGFTAGYEALNTALTEMRNQAAAPAGDAEAAPAE